VARSLKLQKKRDEREDARMKNLQAFGFTGQQTCLLVSSNRNIVCRTPDGVNKLLQFLLDFGISKEVLIKAICAHPPILSLTLSQAQGDLEAIQSLGFSKKEIAVILKRSGSFFLRSPLAIVETHKELLSLGFSRRQAKKALKLSPFLFGLKAETIRENFSGIEALGFSKQDLCVMISKYPTIVGITSETVKKKFENFRIHGVDWKTVKSMVLKNPGAILGNSIERTTKALKWMAKNRISFKSANPNILFPSVEKMEARRVILASKGIDYWDRPHLFTISESQWHSFCLNNCDILAKAKVRRKRNKNYTA
jgi:hypothetical protein